MKYLVKYKGYGSYYLRPSCDRVSLIPYDWRQERYVFSDRASAHAAATHFNVWKSDVCFGGSKFEDGRAVVVRFKD